MTDPAPLRSRVPAIAGSATATVGVAVAASYLGRFGTYGALAAGSVLFSVIAALAEHRYQRAAQVARSRFSQMRRRTGETQRQFERRVRAGTALIPVIGGRRSVPWRAMGLMTAGALLASGAVIGGWELAAGAQVADIVSPPHPQASRSAQRSSPVIVPSPGTRHTGWLVTPSPSASASPSAIPAPPVSPSSSATVMPAPATTSPASSPSPSATPSGS